MSSSRSSAGRETNLDLEYLNVSKHEERESFHDVTRDVKDPELRTRLEKVHADVGHTRHSALLVELIQENNRDEARARAYKRMAITAVVFLFVSILANLGTSWAVYVLNKDTSIETANAIPTEYAVSQGTESSASPQHKVFADTDGVPLRTDRSLDRMKLSSELPDDAWNNLQQLHIKGTGGDVHFTVGVARWSSCTPLLGTCSLTVPP